MNKKKRILIILIVFTLAFIWGHSLIDREHSAEESRWVMKLVTPLLELFVGRGNVTDHLVRKLAHFCEFALLGAELMWFWSLDTGCREILSRRAFLLSAAHGIFAAMTDETIQIFTGRGPMLQDVWLDSSGALSGALFTTLILIIAAGNRKR